MIPGETILSQRALGMKVDPHIGEFKVIRSQGNGYFYVGTMMIACGNPKCDDCVYVLERPPAKGTEVGHGSRETDYFETEQEAIDALEEYKKTGSLPGMRS